jgi:hypothetical protein
MANTPNDIYLYNTLQGRPYSADTRVAQGDPYLTDHTDAVADIWIDRFVQREIVDKAPEPWMASLKLMMQKSPIEVGSLTFEWPESTLGITAVEVETGASAVVGVANTASPQTIVLTSATAGYTAIDNIITYPNSNLIGIVTAKSGATITVSSLRGQGLPAVVTGDKLPTGKGQLRGDAMDRAAYVTRTTQSRRYNYIQTISEWKRWGPDEMAVLQNQLRTNQLQFERMDLTRRLRIGMFANFIAGARGAGVLSGGEDARTTAGVYPQMIEAGAFNDTVSMSAFKAAFEYGAFNTNYKGTRKMVVARTAVLNLFQETYKHFLTRYTNDQMGIKLDITSVTIGGIEYVLVPSDMFGAGQVFGPEWRNRMLVLAMDDIDLVKLKGRYFMSTTQTKTLEDGDGSLKDYKYDAVFAKFGVKHAFAENSFALTINDMVN